MRFTNGFIRVDRDLRDKFFYGDCIGHDLFNYITANVEWDANNISIYTKGRHNYEVKFGQIITTKKLISEHLGIDPRVVTKKLDKLKKVGLIFTENLYNCIRIELCSAYMHAIVKPLASHNESTCTTNEPSTTYKSLDSNKLESCQNQPKNSSQKSQEYDSEGTKNLFDTPENGKNTPPTAAAQSSSTMTPNDLFKLWNEHSGALSKIRDLSPKRQQAAKSILKRISNPDDWITIIKAVAQSPHHRGDNERGWKANFDWVIKDTNNIISKALEGSLKTVKKDRLNSYAQDIEIPF